MQKKLVSWMNTLPIEELATIDFLHEARKRAIVVKAMKFMMTLELGSGARRYDLDCRIDDKAIVRRFQRFLVENVEEMKTEVLPSNFLEGNADTWMTLRRLHEIAARKKTR